MRLYKLLIVAGLAAFVFVWVCLMSLIGGASAGTPPFVEDGSLKATIANIDNQNFDITLSVRVNQSDGQVRGGLEEKDFEVFEDGQPVKLTRFVSAGKQTVRACLLIDYSGSMSDAVQPQGASKMEGAKSAALTFLGLLHNDTDEFGLYFFESNVRIVCPVQPLTAQLRDDAERQIQKLTPQGGTQMYRAMEEALEPMAKLTGRRLMLVLTDGIDDTKDKVQRARIIKRARELNIPLYMIGLGPKEEIDEPAMQEFAKETGGEYSHAPTNEILQQLYKKIGETLQNEYALSYRSPSPVEDGQARKVEVRARSGKSGAVARGQYTVAGVLGGARKKADATDSAPAAPFATVFIPLLVLLGALFAIPYILLLARGDTPTQSVPPPTPPVRTAPVVSAPTPAWPAPPAPVPPPPRPVPAPAPSPARSAPAPTGAVAAASDLCPRCHIKALGKPGQRFCMGCGETY